MYKATHMRLVFRAPARLQLRNLTQAKRVECLRYRPRAGHHRALHANTHLCSGQAMQARQGTTSSYSAFPIGTL